MAACQWWFPFDMLAFLFRLPVLAVLICGGALVPFVMYMEPEWKDQDGEKAAPDSGLGQTFIVLRNLYRLQTIIKTLKLLFYGMHVVHTMK